MIEWFAIGLVVVLAGVAVYYYNKIIVLSNRIDNAWAQIDVQLKKRTDLVPGLIKMATRVMKQEKELFQGLARAREGLSAANTPATKAKFNNQLEGFLTKFFARVEAYPELKSDQNMRMAQEELAGVEGKIAYTRQAYNDQVLSFNNVIQQFPGNVFAGIFNKSAPKEYFEVADTDKKKPDYDKLLA